MVDPLLTLNPDADGGAVDRQLDPIHARLVNGLHLVSVRQKA
jgi:hypothetical protein